MFINPKFRLPLAVALMLAWWLACWWGTGLWQDRAATQAYKDAHQRIEQFMDTSIAGYERIITTRRGMLRVLGRDPIYSDAMSRHTPLSTIGSEDERRRRWNADPQLTAVNRQLAAVARDLGMRSIWLMDVHGDCIASSNAGEPTDHVGTHYADRYYFQEALSGHAAHQVTMGRRQLGASISFSAPVTNQNGRVVGVLAGANDLSTFTSWLDQSNTFFTDRHGVVLLSKDTSMILHALPNAPVQSFDAVTRKNLYKTSDIPKLNLPLQGDERFPELLRLSDDTAPTLLGSRAVSSGEPVLHVLEPLPQLPELSRQRAVNAGTLGLLGILFFLLITSTLRRRREQRAMAQALVQREQHATQASDFLNQIVNSIADPLVVKDHQHRWILVNQAFCKFMGHAQVDLIGKTARDFFPEREANRIWDTDERVLNSGIESISEDKLTDSQGITHIVVTKKTPYTDPQGNRFLVGIVSDISERKQVERLLRTREREFSSLAENLPVAVIRYDSDCRRRYLNPSAERMLHGSPSELLGNEPGGPTVPASPAMIAHYRSKMEEVLATDRTHELDFVLDALPADRQEHYDVRFVPEHDTDGQTIGVLAIWYDITLRKQLENELKQREAEFRGLAENLPDPVFRYGRDGRRLYVNPAAMRITGMTKDQLLGHQPTNCTTVTPEDSAKLMAGVREVVATGERRSFSVGYISQDGSVREHQGLLVPEFDANGQVASVLTMAHDVSALRKAERRTASFFANMPGFAYTLRLSPDGHASLPFVSNGIEDLYGLRPEDVRDDASLLYDMEHPEDRTRVDAASAIANQTLQPFQAEFRVHRPGHPLRWIENRSMPERQADGEVLWHGVMLDITERKRMEEALTNSESRYRNNNSLLTSIFESPSRMYIYALDRNYRYLAFNDQFRAAAKRAWGADITVGMSMLEAIDTEAHREFCRKGYDHVLAGHSFTLESHETFAREGGTVHEYHDNYGSPIRNDEGEIVGLTVFAINISERKRIEAQLTEALKFSNSIINTMPDMVWLKDAHGVYQICNPALTRLTGVAVSDMIGRTDHDLFEPELADFFRLQDHKAIEAGCMRLNEEWVTYAADGCQALLETRKVPMYDANGQFTGVLGIARDVTELKNAEFALRTSEALSKSRNELLQAIMESSPDVIVFALDTSYRYLAFNHKHQEAMKTLWGQEISIGMNMLDAIRHHPDRQAAQQILNRALTGENFALEETDSLTHQHWVTHWSPIRTETGEVMGLTCFALDATERKQAEERLRKSHDILRALAAHKETEHEKERKELAYKIHEDLAQNLAALRMNLSFLTTHGDHIKDTAEFKTLNDITQHCISRIRDIVSVLRPTVLDLGLVPALQWLIDDFKGIGFKFDTSLQEDIALSDEAATVLFRAAQEALLNVALHAGATDVCVTLDELDGHCRLTISDNGCGFDTLASHQQGHFGLIGLTEQTHHLGGAVAIQSQPGQGCSLTILMPTGSSPPCFEGHPMNLSHAPILGIHQPEKCSFFNSF